MESCVAGSMAAPGVSVVVPAFNSTKTLPHTIRSILMQTYSDFELIVVDDGSTDAFSEVMGPFAAQDDRVRIVHQANSGLAAARNRGLGEARGQFVGFVDADDLWHPDYLTALVAALEAAPDAPFGYAYSYRIDAHNNIIPTKSWSHIPRHDFLGLLEVNSVGNGSASLFRAQAIRAVGGFDMSLGENQIQGAEDWKLCLTLAAVADPVLVPRQLVCYRLLETSMSQANPARQLAAVMGVLADIRANFPSLPEKHFLQARTMMNGWLLSAFVRKREWPVIRRMLTQSYIANPLWFRSRDLRAIHSQKILSIIQGCLPRKPLYDLLENGERPFGYMCQLDQKRRTGGLVPCV